MSTPELLTLISVPVADLVPDPDNPRKPLPDEELRPLGESMLATGQQQPIAAYEDIGKYIVQNGNRRVAAAKLVGITKLLTVIVPKPQGGRKVLGQMAENKARKGLTPIEDADVLVRAKRENPQMTSREIAAHTGYSESEVSKCVAVAACPVAYAALAAGTLHSVNEAYAVAKSRTPEEKAWRLALKAAGASSQRVANAVFEAPKPKEKKGESKKPSRVPIPLGKSGAVVTVTADVQSLDGLIACLTDAIELARRALKDGISLATARRAWADKAGAK